MEPDSFQAMLQDEKGNLRFHEELISLIEEKTAVAVGKLISILRTANLWNSCDSSGNTLLHLAAQCNNRCIVDYLIESGSRVDVQNQLGETPLILAIDNRSRRCTECLLEANANIFISDNSEKNALRWYLEEEWFAHFYLTQMLLEKVESQCLGNCRVIAEKLLEAGWPLYSVILLKNIEVTEIMLNRGCPIDTREPYSGNTALHLAVIYQDVQHVKFLLDNNANPNIGDTLHRTPLSHVYEDRRQTDERIEMVQLLIAAGAALITTEGIAKYKQVNQVLQFGDGKVIDILFQANFTLPIDYEHDDDSSLHALVFNITNPNVYKIYVAHVALQKLSGVCIDNFVNEQIQANPVFNDYLKFCLQKLIVRFHEALTLLDVLTLSDFEFTRYIQRSREFCSRIESFDGEWHVNNLYYFHTILQKRYSNVVRLLELKMKAARHLCQFMKIEYSQYPSIVDQIINYLSEKDLQNFLQVSL